MNRMTDERLAEIEARHDYASKYFGGNEPHPPAHKDRGELLQALKAERERVEELEAVWHQHIQVSVNNAFTIVSLEKQCDELNVALCEAVQAKAKQVGAARTEAYQMILDFDNKLRELAEWWSENTEPQSEAWDLAQAIIKTLDRMNT